MPCRKSSTYSPGGPYRNRQSIWPIRSPGLWGGNLLFLPVGRAKGQIYYPHVQSAPCHVAGADEVIKAMEDYLGIKVGETTADGKFTLELCECIGQCQATPVISVNSKPIFNVTAQQIPEILGQYK